MTTLRRCADSPEPSLVADAKCYICNSVTVDTPGRRVSKTLIPSTNVGQKSLETEFSIAICRPTGDK